MESICKAFLLPGDKAVDGSDIRVGGLGEIAQHSLS